jgi:hypothetical protein
VKIHRSYHRDRALLRDRSYALDMRVSYLLFLCLVQCCPVISQNHSASQETNPPALPVIDHDACPFEGCTFGEWSAKKRNAAVHHVKADRVQIGNLIKGQKVDGLTGVHVTKKPDTIRALVDMPELSLKKGETFFRYMYRGEGARRHLGQGQMDERNRLHLCHRKRMEEVVLGIARQS